MFFIENLNESIWTKLGYLEIFELSVFYFVSLYILLTISFWTLTNKILLPLKFGRLISNSNVPTQQTLSEIFYSICSILIFGFIGILVLFGQRNYLWNVQLKFELQTYMAEVGLLFIWNDLHFYLTHRMLHQAFFYKHIHYLHHKSRTTTVFSVFSMHYAEALLLGFVMPLALLAWNFSVWSLMTLPVFSLVLNVLAHCNYDFFSQLPKRSFFAFTTRHAQHHHRVGYNFGFFLPVFDRFFGTGVNENPVE